MKSGERIGGYPSVLEGRVGHKFQFLDRCMDASRKHITDRGEVDHELFDKVPFQLSERDIF